MKKARQQSSQLAAGFESDSSFQDFFSKIFGDVSVRSSSHTALKAASIDTVLGPMIAIADDVSLYLLEFLTRRGLEKEIMRLDKRGLAITPGDSLPIQSIMTELHAYFSGTLEKFNTPYRVFGSSFQQDVWRSLCDIPYGETRSYLDQAISLGRPTSCRAVANANGANQLAIIIPCHRVISSDGSLGGYGGGQAVKQWLLEHEKKQTQYS